MSSHEVRFRSSPHVELALLDQLPPEQREPLAGLAADAAICGVLVPRSPLTTPVKAVERQTAELFRTLAAPAPLGAAYFDGGRIADDVVELVLDGILEIESGAGFVYGADALPLLSPAFAPPRLTDATARLSHEALLHAQDLATSDPSALTAALYFYNRIPLSPFWTARFGTVELLLDSLGAKEGPLAALLERRWAASDAKGGWLSWMPRTDGAPGRRDAAYKLYVSPRPERIRPAFEVVVRVLAGFPGIPFKIGTGAPGVLRPDKLVAYFASRERLDEAAALLRRELAGCEAHGVPFSAGIDESGLLSWGMDPPDGARLLRWVGRDSWRSWLTKRLGLALSTAKSARTADAAAPWRFALDRVGREGVDVESWTPSAGLWRSA